MHSARLNGGCVVVQMPIDLNQEDVFEVNPSYGKQNATD
jgi:hypothetical protein